LSPGSADKEDQMTTGAREGFRTVTPYLMVPDAEKLISFARDAFGAEETFRATHPDGRIMHAEIRIGDSMLMMGQAAENWPAQPSSIFLYVDDADATYERALDAGATALMEPADHDEGDRRGGVKDRSGVSWWIATHTNPAAWEEMKKRSANAG
jgi:PhnB protein